MSKTRVYCFSEADAKLFRIFLLSFLGLLSVLFILGGTSWAGWDKTPDFGIFYSEARLVIEYQPERIYDLELQEKMQTEILGEGVYGTKFLPFIHPPFELFLFLPLASFSFTHARLIWFILNLGLILLLPLGVSYAAPEIFKKHQYAIVLGATSFYPFLISLWQGQVTIIFLWLLILTYMFIQKGQEFWAGVMLGLAFFRFYLVFPLVAIFLLKRRIQGILGLICCLSLLAITSAIWIGLPGVQSYFVVLKKMSATHGQMGMDPGKFHNWMGQLYLLGFKETHGFTWSLGFALLAIVLLGWFWRGRWNPKSSAFQIHFAATVLLGLLASPYLYIQDLSAMYLVLALCFEFLLITKEPEWKWLLLAALLALSPMVWMSTLIVSRSLPIQISVVWMTVTFFLLREFSERFRRLNTDQ